MPETLTQTGPARKTASEEAAQEDVLAWARAMRGLKKHGLGLIHGYSQVFFSKSPLAGFLFLAATFVVPLQGAAGMLGLVLSNFWARAFGFPCAYIKEGFFAYNGLLIGLALGLTWRPNGAFFFLLVLASLMGVFIAAGLRALFERYVFVPVLSLPFVLTTWIVLAAGRDFHSLIYTLDPFEAHTLAGVLPGFLETAARNLGAAFFQMSPASGILVALGLLVHSRQAAVLAAIGLGSGVAAHQVLGGDPAGITTGLAGFNFVLAAIAVGGVWTVPSWDSYLLAAAAGALCAVVTAAGSLVLDIAGLPPLAAPFVATTMVMLYAFKLRGPSNYFKTVAIPACTPEKNLKQFKNARSRYITGEFPAFALPVSGQWTVTQGFYGEHTHQGPWAHAWDLEITDDQGGLYQSTGSRVEDFYAWDKPVFAPADGKVVFCRDHLADNPVGQVDTQNNWGNLVIVWHYGQVFTALCHLKKDSAAVKEGEVVQKGQVLGKVGNSGRSPAPHLHFQVQATAEVGAPTLDAELMHYVKSAGGEAVYHTHGRPQKGDRIQALEAAPRMFDTAGFALGRTFCFAAIRNNRAWTETWESRIDFDGTRYLWCEENKARLTLFVNRQVLLLLDYQGPVNTGLYWFYLAVPRMPMTGKDLAWTDTLPPERMLGWVARQAFDLAEPLASLARLDSSSRFCRREGHFGVRTLLASSGPLAPPAFGELEAKAVFERYRGLSQVQVKRKGDVIFELTAVQPGGDGLVY